MRHRKTCPGCGGKLTPSSIRLPRQPVVLNYRFTSVAEARRVARRDLVLRQCAGCGLVFNAAFDPKAIPYDTRYENRQCFSPIFQQHLETLATRLSSHPGLRGGRILEVGCGKGDFLRVLCQRARASGTGYDTTYQGRGRWTRPRLVFHRKYMTAADVRGAFNAVICRHVVEHVPEIGSFLRELRATAAAAGDPVVVIETPSLEWIEKHLAFWDLFYEHCNYFALPTLAHLCRLAGFRVLAHRTVFGRQYQLLELRVDRRVRTGRYSAAPVTGGANLGLFARAARKRMQELETTIRRAGGTGRWAIWGAGAKGVALVHRLKQVRPRFLVDTNRAKQGCYVPGTAIPIVSPDDPRMKDLRLVLVANPNYEAEVTSALRARGFAPSIRSL